MKAVSSTACCNMEILSARFDTVCSTCTNSYKRCMAATTYHLQVHTWRNSKYLKKNSGYLWHAWHLFFYNTERTTSRTEVICSEESSPFFIVSR